MCCGNVHTHKKRNPLTFIWWCWRLKDFLLQSIVSHLVILVQMTYCKHTWIQKEWVGGRGFSCLIHTHSRILSFVFLLASMYKIVPLFSTGNNGSVFSCTAILGWITHLLTYQKLRYSAFCFALIFLFHYWLPCISVCRLLAS